MTIRTQQTKQLNIITLKNKKNKNFEIGDKHREMYKVGRSFAIAETTT